MIQIEKKLWNEGYKYIACIDEVGRGCLLGDVVACAIIMPIDELIEGIKDSKKISQKKREKLYDSIIDRSLGVGIGRVDAKTIDEINIKKATLLAMKKAIGNIKDKDGNKIEPDYLLIDAEKLDVDIPQENIIKGDEKCYGIASASIIAKVYRDRLCGEWDKDYPEYGIEKHKGYGTKQHREMILTCGITPIHRKTFLTKILSQK
ncbi:ribonuclease HII [Gottschalkia acidurici 9a]|uniref:Ribonuclease HII n=1 Tax=Gottschalkia acidurici (strain ATCC 7906 / DSM 604 / BCRC 14475 / CIP 104303 / KCTC 5404 / NCIMB 10678 / 9a) TaxID=1128398 RepID=K0B114_GOTA9|nr:ribonuclease HII [Gottschalkia acidurici]AFS78625.1 ribonuclease HII [Gottschalkia acidurici 9a]